MNSIRSINKNLLIHCWMLIWHVVSPSTLFSMPINLSYTGAIKAITDKAVTITKYGQNHRLNIYEFCWRNWDFNAAETAARNAETSMYI